MPRARAAASRRRLAAGRRPAPRACAGRSGSTGRRSAPSDRRVLVRTGLAAEQRRDVGEDLEHLVLAAQHRRLVGRQALARARGSRRPVAATPTASMSEPSISARRSSSRACARSTSGGASALGERAQPDDGRARTRAPAAGRPGRRRRGACPSNRTRWRRRRRRLGGPRRARCAAGACPRRPARWASPRPRAPCRGTGASDGASPSSSPRASATRSPASTWSPGLHRRPDDHRGRERAQDAAFVVGRPGAARRHLDEVREAHA